MIKSASLLITTSLIKFTNHMIKSTLFFC